MADVGAVPEPVRRYADRVLSGSQVDGRKVRVGQSGEMILKPGAAPRRFTATEEFAVDRVAFTWRARFPMVGPVALGVTGGYDGSDGQLDVRLLVLPLQRRRGPELARAEAVRYLAEIAWVPHAILRNPQLEWRELDQHTVEVATIVRSARIAVRLVFNEDGEITQAIADRPRTEAGNAITRWVGEYAAYRDLGGVLVPAHAEVHWELPEGRSRIGVARSPRLSYATNRPASPPRE